MVVDPRPVWVPAYFWSTVCKSGKRWEWGFRGGSEPEEAFGSRHF